MKYLNNLKTLKDGNIIYFRNTLVGKIYVRRKFTFLINENENARED